MIHRLAASSCSVLSLVALPLALAVVACGPPSHAPIADAPGVDAGPCGANVPLAGDVVDWDSTDTQFCGVFGAHLVVHGDPTRSETTPPNGRINLCVAAGAVQLDITPPTGNSQCAMTAGAYAVPGALFVDGAVLAAGATVRARAFTAPRGTTLGYDAAKAQVFVHVAGAAPRAVAITGTHDAPIAFDGTASAPGSTGVDVFFANVDPAVGSVMVSVTGGAIGAGPVPVTAGAFSYVTVLAN